MTTSNEHNNAPAVPLGYINAGHLHEMQSGRLPYAYLYAEPGVGVEIPVYTSNAPTAPQGWKMDRDGADAIVISHHAVGLAKACNPPRSAHEHLLFMLCDDILQDGDTLAPAPAPAQERCSTCGYLTSEREHLGCLRRAVKDLDIATGGPYDAQEVGLTDETQTQDELHSLRLTASGGAYVG